ncbi:hypothetical protein VTO73DRAFT_5655 [Trametes versicolor]
MSDPASSSGAPLTGMNLPDSFGVLLLSTIIVSALYGITVLQTLYYYERFPKDPWRLKTAVAVIWVLDTVTIVLDAHMVYYYLIDNYNNPTALLSQVWSGQVELLFTYIVVLMVQIFFVLRIYQLRPKAWYIPLLMGILAFVSFGLIVAIVAREFKHTAWNDVQTPQVLNVRIANWVFGMVVDISITAVLCWYLASEKTYIRRRTHRMLNRIILFSVHRGAIAAALQVLTLLTKFIWPHTLVWLAFHNALSKVYSNSMLATLNSRIHLRDMMMKSDADGTELSLPTVGQNKRSGDHQNATLQFAHAWSSVYEQDSMGSSKLDSSTGGGNDTSFKG